jgi:hypothetical protein
VKGHGSNQLLLDRQVAGTRLQQHVETRFRDLTHIDGGPGPVHDEVARAVDMATRFVEATRKLAQQAAADGASVPAELENARQSLMILVEALPRLPGDDLSAAMLLRDAIRETARRLARAHNELSVTTGRPPGGPRRRA